MTCKDCAFLGKSLLSFFCFHPLFYKNYNGKHIDDINTKPEWCPLRSGTEIHIREKCTLCNGTGRINGSSGIKQKLCTQCMGLGRVEKWVPIETLFQK